MRQPQSISGAFRDKFHPSCLICGRENAQGMRLPFRTRNDGSVRARFICSELLQGYPGIVHGGVIAAVLDGAMMNCLFAHNILAVTGTLSVRFLLPLAARKTATVQAHIKRSVAAWHILESELLQGKRIVAKGTAKFMECTEHFLKQHKMAGGAPR